MMTKQNQQDVLTDIMIEMNLLADRAFYHNDKRALKLIEVMNERLVYLWGSLNNE